jgi:large subunit ribosomal protein L22
MAALEENRTSVRAEARYVRTAPRKAQLVAAEIRGRPVPEARTILAFMTRDAARDVEKVLSSAVANAEANHGLDGDELYVSAATVGAGPTLKRWRARARGRVARIKKRTCHIVVELALPDEQVVPEPVRRAAPAAAPAPEPEEAPAAEEKPKRTPPKKAEPADEAATEKPKPKRATRKKAETPNAKETEGRSKARTTKKSSGSTSKTSSRSSKKTEGES